jgi:hypothetical protein
MPQHRPAMPLPWWLQAAVIVGALLMLSGAIIALVRPEMLVSPGDAINGPARIYAGYLFSRNLTLAVMLMAALIMRARSALRTLMVLTAFIQLLDAIVDATEGRWVIVPGVLVFALVFFAGAACLRQSTT